LSAWQEEIIACRLTPAVAMEQQMRATVDRRKRKRREKRGL
jgi:hypothetical protein